MKKNANYQIDRSTVDQSTVDKELIMKYIDVVGKSIEEAIKQGLNELNTSEDNVEVTVPDNYHQY